MLELRDADGGATRIAVVPAPRAIVSWATSAPAATIELTVHTLDGRCSRRLPYVTFEPGARTSLDGFDGVARIATDVVHAGADIVAIDVAANAPLTAVGVSVPVHAASAPAPPFAGELDVPERSQYDAAAPQERGWCAPASLAMLLGAHGIERGVAEVAAHVYDRAYGGTGNWSFAIAYAAACGLAGAAAYLRDLRTLDGFLAAGLPCIVSIAWQAGTLPGAPLESSSGHLVVVRGRSERGVIVNDPAQPAVRHTYDADAFERAWLGHGGVALLLAPLARRDELVRCANA